MDIHSLKELLIKDIEQVISILRENTKDNLSVFDELLLIEGRYNDLLNRRKHGIVSNENYNLEINTIRYNILEVLNKQGAVEEEQKDIKEKQLFASRPDSTILNPNLRTEILEKHNVLVKIDSSPDLLPRFIRLERSGQDFLSTAIKTSNIETLVFSIDRLFKKFHELSLLKDELNLLNFQGVSNTSSDKVINFENVISEIEHSIKNLSLLKNIFKLEFEETSGLHYVTEGTIGKILPNTILSQIIGNTSPLAKLGLKFSSEMDFSVNTRFVEHRTVNVNPKTARFVEVREMPRKHIALSILDDSSTKITFINDDFKDIESILPIVNENILSLNPSFKIFDQFKDQVIFEGKLEADSIYQSELFQLAHMPQSSFKLIYEISRGDLVSSLFSLIDQLKRLHEKGLVHGDLNPKNILIVESGFVFIDSLDIRKNNFSHGLTPYFCSPEQVLRKPITPQSDIYNLGLLLIMIVEGIIYGKLDKFVFPSTRNELEETVLITKPSIFIDPKKGILDEVGLTEWSKFLIRCIQFDVEDRIKSIDQFEVELRDLHEKYPLKGGIDFEPDLGELILLQSGKQQYTYLGRVIDC